MWPESWSNTLQRFSAEMFIVCTDFTALFFFLFVLIESIFFQRKAAAANATTQQHALGKRPGKMSQSQTR